MNRLQAPTPPPYYTGDGPSSHHLPALGAKCPSCGSSSTSSHHRIVMDACGHFKCRKCLLVEENECSQCMLSMQETSRGDGGLLDQFPERCSVIVTAPPTYRHNTPEEDFENKLEGIVLQGFV